MEHDTVRSMLLAVALGTAFSLNGSVRAQSDVEAWFDRLIEAYGTADVEWIAEHDILSVAGCGFGASDWRDPLSSDANN